MSSLFRALRPQRNEIKKLIAAKPDLTRLPTLGPQEQYGFLVDLEVYKGLLTAARGTFHELYLKLLTLTAATEADQKTIDDTAETDSALLIEVDRVLIDVTAILNRWPEGANDATHDVHNRAQRENPGRPLTVNLPKLEMRKFSGNAMQWQEFWDSFESAVHNNDALTSVDKFNYLKGQLTGDAQAAITGLALTNDNYALAVQILKDRFGNQQLVINAHYAALSNLCPAPDHTAKIRIVVDAIEKHLRSLEALRQDISHAQFIPMMISKLPRNFVLRLEENRGDEPWTVNSLRKKVQALLAAREIVDQQQPPAPPPKQWVGESQRNGGYRSTTDALMANSGAGNFIPPADRKTCAFCKQAHWSDECPRYDNISARRQQVRDCCFVCLRHGHRRSACRMKRPCPYCKRVGDHHRSLCPKRFPLTGAQNESTLTVTDREADQAGNTSSHPSDTSNHMATEKALLSTEERGMLQTARTTVMSVDEVNRGGAETRLIFDTGSQRTYVSQSLVKKLRIQPTSYETLLVFTFGSAEPQKIQTGVVKLRMKALDGSFLEVTANVVPQINGCVEHVPLDPTKLGPLYRNLPLADPFTRDKHDMTIDLLIGNDYYWDLITSDRIELTKGLYLIGSKLGWTISGRTKGLPEGKTKPSLTMLTSVKTTRATEIPFVPADRCLSKDIDLSDWWALETMGVTDRPDVTDDDRALQHFNETVQYDEQRYYVTWPWKDNADELPSNYGLALGRLNALVRRLRDSPDIVLKYDEVICTQLEKGIIEKVQGSTVGTRHHYIPHHPVITPERTTKLRVVYDGSAKANKMSPSINECLYRGPVILEDLCKLLIRFRCNKLALIADIEKAFLQVGLQSQERDVTRFLWLKDPKRLTTTDNLEVYRFTRVPFGIISSPFLLGATICYHLSKEGSATAKNIVKNIYVDNLITGTPTVPEAITFYQKAKHLFQSASMNLREWLSNSRDLMAAIPESDRANMAQAKVLGVQWNIETDTLQIPLSLKIPCDPASKRTVLKSIAAVFDPLGLAGPALLPAKLFLQSLWTEDMNWDTELSSEKAVPWHTLASAMESLATLSVPRYVGPQLTDAVGLEYELHCFCDASQVAYGACVYIRVRCDNETLTHLVFSKSRLAPKRIVTLPRLELLAVTIGYRCLKFVESAVAFPVAAKFLWTDSQCVLHWIRSTKQLSVFVANRVRELRQSTNVQFGYVATDCNPADIASRGCTASDLKESGLWWHGPSWLNRSADEWPCTNETLRYDSSVLQQIATEERKSTLFETTSLAVGGPPEVLEDQVYETPFGIDETRYSTLEKLLRVTAWCNRFCANARKARNEELPHGSRLALTAKEIQAAKTLWIRAIQKKHFADVILAMEARKRNPLSEQLGLWLDESTILRCKGRLQNADLGEFTMFPVLLPKKSWFTTLVIKRFHERFFHAGTAHTISGIRREYWIPSGRSVVYKHIRSCLTCKRYDGGPYRPPEMPPLPQSRVTKSTPFTYTGLDYLGPLYVKGNEEAKKVWICLFTCMATRAIHLELVGDLSAAEFLMCVRRFVSRRGKPTVIISDNAAQFKLTKSALDDLWSKVISNKDVETYCSDQGISWSFIVERAPWMGGFYERLVQSVKRALKKSVQRVCLTVTQLQTVITEIEAVLNSRPLVYVGSDFNDGTALTPSHFLSPNTQTGIPDMDCGDLEDPEYVARATSKAALLSTWKKGEKHLQSFWKVWKNDYLLSLRERTQTKIKQPRRAAGLPKIGDIVHVQNDSPRGSWQLGRIAEVCQGKDGQIRSAKVQLPAGKTITRAIMHLYPMEIGDEKEFGKTATPAQESTAEEHVVQPRAKREAAKKALDRIVAINQDDDQDDIE